MMPETLNLIQRKEYEEKYVYYEINNELIIDDSSVYFRKASLDAYYEAAHGAWITEQQIIKNTSEIELPFENAEELIKNNNLSITVEQSSNLSSVAIESDTNNFILPIKYVYDETAIQTNQKIIEGLEEKLARPNPSKEDEELLLYHKDLQKNLIWNQVYSTVMKVSSNNKSYEQNVLKGTQELYLPEELMTYFTNTEVYLSFKGVNYSYIYNEDFTENINSQNPVKQIEIPKEQILIAPYVDNMIVKLKYDSNDIVGKTLLFNKDFIINETNNTIIFMEEIKFNCKIEVTISHPDTILYPNIDYTLLINETNNEITSVIYKLKKPIPENGIVIFTCKSEDYVLQHIYPDRVGYYIPSFKDENAAEKEIVINLQPIQSFTESEWMKECFVDVEPIQEILFEGDVLLSDYIDTSKIVLVYYNDKEQVVEKELKYQIDYTVNQNTIKLSNELVMTSNFRIYVTTTIPNEKPQTLFAGSKIEYGSTYSYTSVIELQSFNKETNTIKLKKEITASETSPATIIYRKSGMSGGDLSLIFYYRTKKLDPRFLSDLKPNWDTNNEQDSSYIYNRPFWNNGIEIVMNNGVNAPYRNGEKTYYNFFLKMIEEFLNNLGLDTNIASLSSRLKELEVWVKAHSWIDTNFGEYGENIVEAIKTIIDKIGVLEEKIKNSQEVYIGINKPELDDEFKHINYKIWINIHPDNGNGLIYYKFNNKWIPVSALWTNSPDLDAL